MNHTKFPRLAVAALFVLAIVASVANVSAQLPAFPGAQGFGRFATGGRGGSVYFVTTTNDTGAGSFRDAVSVSGRTIIFRVGGVIDYQSPRYAPQPNITIAGQTAPGDGVTIYGDGLSFSGSHNNICRFIRVRQGINGTSGTDAMGIANGNNMIFDHITSSWGRDETFSISGNISNITIQSSIISQGLQGHSAGGLIQTDGGVSILRSLYIDNDTRNPKVKGVSEFVNNVICNWETIGYNMGGDSAGESFVNVFNNYFMRGPASGSTAIGGGNTDFHIFRANNWYDSNRNGVLDGADLSVGAYGSHDAQAAPYGYPVTTNSAYSPLTALKLAISDAGPSFKRDSVDELMIQELTSWGLDGGTITSELIAPMSGPGVVRNGTPYADADNDGMPDFWENGTGSNPASANNNAASPSGSGYTRLEDYLNWLAEPHGIALQNTNVVIDLRQFTRGWVVVNRSPFWTVNNPTNGTVTLTNGYMALFAPTLNLNSNASFAFTVNDTDGGPVTRTMNLFFTPSAQSYTPVWHGDDIANTWDALGDYNWHDGISLLYQFHNGEAAIFDDTGSTNPAVKLSGSLTPASVTINAKKNYTFSGSGSLDGSMALNKTNTGTLTINNTNGYTGNTTVSNGTLLVHGALNSSAVTVRNSGTVGGNGQLGNSLTAASGSSIAPGNGVGSPGTLTITNALTLSGGVTSRFDLSDDPTGVTKTNDAIRVFGNLNLSGVNTLKFTLLDGLPGNGVYTLITYSGALSGSLANFSLSGISGTLTNPPGAIAIIVNASRPPATLTWTGNGGNNFWDTGTNVCWLNDIIADKFYFGDDVMFDNTGASNLTATLVGDQTPASVTVNATANYTMTGAGKITGTTGLVKTNSGTLTISTANDFTGATVIGGGTLSVSSLANGGAASGIGAASTNVTDLVMFNGKLSYTGGSASTDRGATFNGGANFDVTSGGTTLTWNGVFVGGGSLIKSGAGQLTLSGENAFSSGTIVSNGTLALFGPSGGATVTANNYSLGSGNVTLYGGTLKLFGGDLGDAAAGYGTFSRPIVVPAGATATILTPARYTMSSSLTGGGTLNLEVNYVRGSLSGNWSAFTGTINITAQSADSEFRVNNSSGYAGATLFVNDGAIITQNGSGSPMLIGALGGTSGGRVGPGNSTSSGRNFSIGWNNQNATFAGQFLADGANTVTKVGTGNWTLSGANTYNGGTIVDGGTLTVNNASGSGTGSGAVTINNTATLAGTGIISGATTINSGATVAPGNGGIGTLTINNSVTLAAGSTTLIEINKTTLAKDMLDSSSTLTYGGSLTVTNVSGTLANGDSFKIFDAGTYSGSFAATNLPALAPDLMWNTALLNVSGTISVVSTNFTGPQPLLWKGDGGANLWDGGTLNWLTTNAIPRAFANGDSVTFDNTGFNSPAINLTATFSPASVTVNSSLNYTFSGVGALTGTMPLTKSGSGTLILANTGGNSYSGTTTINAGALQLGDGVSVTVNQTGNITDNGTLIFANPGALTNSANISGTGALIKNGAGALTLTGSKTYTGLTTINAGTLQLNGTPPPGNIVNNTALTLVPSSPLTYGASISGPGSVTVNSSTTVYLTGASSFSGGLTNTTGSLVLSNNAAAGTGPVIYTAGTVMVGGGCVITNDFSIPGGATTDLSMQGTNGTGIWAGNIVNLGSGASWRPGADTGGAFTFTGNALMGARNFIVPRGSVTIASNAVISATGAATAFGRDGTGGNRSASVTIRDNAVITLGVCNLGGNLAGGNSTVTLQDNAVLNCGANNFDLNNVNRATATTFVRLNGGTMTVGGFTKTKTAQTNVIQFNGGVLKAGANNAAFLPILNVSSNWVQAGGAKIDDGGFSVTINAPLIHDPALGATLDGGLTKFGNGNLTLLDAPNTYTGPTLILQGQLSLSSLIAVASISASTNIHVAAGATFDPSGVGTFTLGSGRRLWGNGTVNGNLTISSSAILEPGTNAIGRITFNNALTLAAGSSNRFELNKTLATNDVARVLGNVSYGGTLIVTNLSGTLAAGDSFQLFNAATRSGSFSSIILPTLGMNLAWTNQLASSGTIAVFSTAPATPPVFNNVFTSGSDLVMSGTNGPANGTYYVLATTNLTLPMTNWPRIATNSFNGSGNFNLTNPVNLSTPQLFYRLQLP